MGRRESRNNVSKGNVPRLTNVFFPGKKNLTFCIPYEPQAVRDKLKQGKASQARCEQAKPEQLH